MAELLKHIFVDVVYDGVTAQIHLQLSAAHWYGANETGWSDARDNLTLDRVRFLGTGSRSICKSGGSGMPKSKPPYLKQQIDIYRSKQTALEAA